MVWCWPSPVPSATPWRAPAICTGPSGDWVGRANHGDLDLRIGLSVGEAAQLPDGSWSGGAVVEAARLVDLAEPGTTLAPEMARRLLGPGSEVRATSVGDRVLQGFPEPLACCEIAWDRDPDELAWEKRQLRQRVRRAAADWESRSRDPADLYRGRAPGRHPGGARAG